jgi:SAM-dependent methyltransferase
MEHLADPQRTCREFARLLASGGVLIVKTPNLSAPVTGLANSLPLGLRRRLKGGLGVGGEHVFATYYRCNTPASVDQAMRGAGLQRDVLLVVDQTYDYLFFSHLTYALGLLYSRWLASNRLRRLGNSIVAVYRKPEYA